jgi:hypothetical protein
MSGSSSLTGFSLRRATGVRPSYTNHQSLVTNYLLPFTPRPLRTPNVKVPVTGAPL